MKVRKLILEGLVDKLLDGVQVRKLLLEWLVDKLLDGVQVRKLILEGLVDKLLDGVKEAFNYEEISLTHLNIIISQGSEDDSCPSLRLES